MTEPFHPINSALAGRLQRTADERDDALARVAELEHGLKRIYLESVGIQTARAIARTALYGKDEDT